MDPAIGVFSLRALHEALDAQRVERGLTWTAVAREVSRRLPSAPTRAVSHSTISGVGSRSVAEGDGVLQMLLWLGRSPESFVPSHPLADDPNALLPDPGDGRTLRFDAPALRAALDRRRIEDGLTWRDVAAAIGCPPGALSASHLGPTSRLAFPSVMSLTTWAGVPAAAVAHATPW